MTLRIGSKGDQVEKVQELLTKLNYEPGRVDGDFGRRTKDAVAAFQGAYLVDGIVDAVTLKALEAAVSAWTQKGEPTFLIPRPRGLAELEASFGKIEFIEAGGGAVSITNDWAAENIERANLPIVGTHLVHKKMVLLFRAVLANIKDKGLDGEILQFGVWSPRHKMHNPNRSLSTHSWAVACDVNWATNAPGKVGDLHPGIVDSFERFGFQWGGRWSYRDDMHFQFCTGH